MRVVTRPDFDGIVCAVLLTDALDADAPIKWTEPNAVQSGLVEIKKGDIIANLAYNPNCHLWFDHHISNRIKKPFNGAFKLTPSAARIIFEFYQGKFKRDFSELVREADRIDSAQLTLDEVLHPENYSYISLDMTISGHRKNDEPYWNKLVRLLREFDIQAVLRDTEVLERRKVAIEENKRYGEYLKKYTRQEGRISVTDFRTLERTPYGNRFLVFSLFPESAVNIKIRFGNSDRDRVIVSVGHSIFNRRCKASAGEICARFGGGGHWGAGSCCFPADQADEIIVDILDILKHSDFD